MKIIRSRYPNKGVSLKHKIMLEVTEIDRDRLTNYLERLDLCVENTITLIEETSSAFDKMIDGTLSFPNFVHSLQTLFDNFNKVYFEDKNIAVDELDPDPIQDLDIEVGMFVSICHSTFIYLYNSDKNNLTNYWYINTIFKDCRIKYEEILKRRRHPEVETIAECKLPSAIILGLESRNLLAIDYKLKKSNYNVTKLELSGNSTSPQLEIELTTNDNNKNSLLKLAFETIQLIEDELARMNNIINIIIAFKIEDRPRNTWLQISRSAVLSLLAKEADIDNFIEIVPFFFYVDDLIKASTTIKDLADNSHEIDKDYEIMEILKEAFDQFDIIKNRAINDESNGLVVFMLENILPLSLLDLIRLMLNVISITGDFDVTQKMIKLIGMFHLHGHVNIKKDYLDIYREMNELMESLEFRYIIINNVKPINVGSKVLDSPRIALVQPQISINRDYDENFN